MKKITNFIVEKRNIILIIFLILSGISLFMSQKVNINYDIAKYLPSTSETRIGMNIMESEFDEEKSSSLNLMFKDLKETEKEEILDNLENIKGVSEVDYDETEEYNKDNYTLYIIQVEDTEDSALAKDVYEKIEEEYQDYEFYTSGSIAERNNPVLPSWIMILAVSCALVILIIMSESYIEPFLFLFTIGIAIILNNGTNIIFNNVSNITNSISAILQMALSMDYSIMLMNRYSQEKETEKDKVKAMKKALYKSFTSISSSSVTTVVGLLALVFMSFTIGKDLGFVLAKGVLFSLISIFTCLPALILIFDKLITKTKKKTLNIKLDKLGNLSYKFRYPALILIIVVFSISYLLRGNLTILYTDSETDKINEIFKENNQLAIIYKNDKEDSISKYCKQLEKNGKVDEVLCYGNTLNEKLTYNELNDKLTSLGSSVTIDDDLLKIIYYHYYNQEEDNKISFEELIKFIEEDVYKNDKMQNNLNSEIKNNISKLSNFATKENITKKRTASELSNILGIDESTVEDILMYYNSKNTNLELTLNEFITFMNNDVLTNKTYSKDIDSNTKNNLTKLQTFTNINTINKKMTSKEMANLFGINESLMESLYSYYISVNEINTKLSLQEFINFVQTDILTNKTYADSNDDTTKTNLQILKTFTNKDLITKNMSSQELANLFYLNEDTVKQLLLLYYSTIDNGTTMSIPEFINNVTYIKNNTNYLDGKDLDSIISLSLFAQNQNNLNTTKIDKEQLSIIFKNINENLVNQVYQTLNLPDNYLMTPQEFVNIVITNFSNSLDESTISNLKLLKMVIDDSINTNPKKYTATELATILNQEKNNIIGIYTITDLFNGNTNNWQMTPNKFVKLILNNSNNPMISNNMDSQTLNKLNLLDEVMTSTINNTAFTYQELSNLIGIPTTNTKQIYALYTSKNYTTTMGPQEFVNFMINHQHDQILASNLSNSMIGELNLVNTVMISTLNNKTYSTNNLSNLLGTNSSDLSLLYALYQKDYQNYSPQISLNEFINFLLNDVMTNDKYSSNFDKDTKEKLTTINNIMTSVDNQTKYTKEEMLNTLKKFTDDIDKNTIELVYIYYGSSKDYQDTWTLTVEKFVNYINSDILSDERFNDFIDTSMKKNIKDAKKTIKKAKNMLVGNNYSRIVINTKLDPESKETFNFIQNIKDDLDNITDKAYIIGDSPMAYEMSKTFGGELDFITILTMIAIFAVVAITFKSIIISIILVLIIQCAVYLTMGILSLMGGDVYFIALLIVQSILMGATIDYAILYTSYYLESRKTMDIKSAVINSYNKSIHTILTSSSILIIVTLIIGNFASAIAAKICKTLSQGTLASFLLILLILPAILATVDKIIIKDKKIKS